MIIAWAFYFLHDDFGAEALHEEPEKFENEDGAENNRNCDDEAILSEKNKIEEVVGKWDKKSGTHNGNNCKK